MLFKIVSLLSMMAVSVQAQDPLCSTGIAGQFGVSAICCPASCGECGGSGCSERPGGADNCCGGSINVPNLNCDVTGPPCVIQRDPECATGTRNDAEGVCCAGMCGSTCGGATGGGCESAFSVDSDTSGRCCADAIKATNRPCSAFAPPCTLAAAPVVTTPTSNGDPTCAGGVIRNNYCCASSCVTCGGTGCKHRPGGPESCCTNKIETSGVSCATNQAPCIM